MIGNFADVMRTSFDTENQLSVGVLNVFGPIQSSAHSPQTRARTD
jgi:hypothetical protein